MTNLRACALTAVAGAVLLTACGKSETPVTPTAPTTSVTSVSISQLPASLRPGETAQLTATATLSDGSTQSATALATWSSSAQAILSVSPTGLVTAVAPGDATVTATYQSRSMTIGMSVRGGQTLQGLITETAPTTTRVVPGAQVTVVDGPYQGASATTDAGGRFSLANVSGALNLRVSKIGFESLPLTADAGGAELTVRLMPAGNDTSVAEYTCAVPCSENLREQGRLTFDLHRGGTVTVSGHSGVWGSDSWAYCAELRAVDTNQVLYTYKSPPGGAALYSQTLDLPGGRSYELRTSSCPAGGGLSHYQLTAIHPS